MNPAPIPRLDMTELERPPLVLVIAWHRRVALSWAGRRDGRREIRPDAADGHTPYTRRLLAQIGTAARAEQLRRQVWASRVGERLARLAAEAEALRHVSHPVGQPGVPDEVNAARRAEAEAAAARRLAEITEETAALDELNHHHERAHAQRLARLHHHGEQLVAVYWRAFVRAHPEYAEMRAGYEMPAVVVPVDLP